MEDNSIVGDLGVGGRWDSGGSLRDGFMIASQNAADQFKCRVLWIFTKDVEELPAEI